MFTKAGTAASLMCLSTRIAHGRVSPIIGPCPILVKTPADAFPHSLRLTSGENFYFVQEDMLKAYAKKSGWTWNVIVRDIVWFDCALLV